MKDYPEDDPGLLAAHVTARASRSRSTSRSAENCLRSARVLHNCWVRRQADLRNGLRNE